MRKSIKTTKWAALLLAVVFAALIVTGCSSSTKQSTNKGGEKFKVAFVYIGPKDDGGYSQAHEMGRQYLVSHMPNVEASYVENVSEVDAEHVITGLAQKGNKVIFTTSFGFMDPTINVAKKFPKVVFLHCSGYKTANNVGTYFGRMYQARYLTGLVAGKMTKTNKIGMVAAYPIPEVVRNINAFTLGVRSVNPNAAVKVVWTQTWNDPSKEKDASKSLTEQNCDVIAQYQDTPASVQGAEEAGKYSIGADSDMHKFGPKGNLTSAVWNWGPYYVKVVKEIMNGRWKSSQYWGPISDNIVDIAPLSSAVPEDVKKLVEEKKALLVSGKWDVFTGPIKDQNGTEKVQSGQKMTDKELLSIDWFVQGVEGTIPKQQ